MRQVLYNTVIVRKRVNTKNENKTWLKSNEDMQISSLYGELYDRISKHYTDLIESGEASIDHSYITGKDVKDFPIDINENKIKDDFEYIYVGIYDNQTSEQIL